MLLLDLQLNLGIPFQQRNAGEILSVDIKAYLFYVQVPQIIQHRPHTEPGNSLSPEAGGYPVVHKNSVFFGTIVIESESSTWGALVKYDSSIVRGR